MPSSISLGFVYILPEGCTSIPNDIDPFNLIIDSVMRQTNTSSVYLYGDFNSRTGILEDFIEPDSWETK